MTVYLDTSVVLGRLLNQALPILGWGDWSACYTSELTRVEFLRSVDRLRLTGVLDDEQRVALHEQFHQVWGACYRVAVTAPLLERASAPMPTVLGTLDAIHLVTAVAVAEAESLAICLLTHDRQLGLAALAMGLEVQGLPP